MAIILIVDDNDQLGALVAEMLGDAGHESIRAGNGKEALRICGSQVVDLVLTDLIMPDLEGTQLIMELGRLYPSVKVIAMSGGGRSSADKYLRIARNLGAVHSLEKPFSIDQLYAAVGQALGLEQKRKS